MTKISEIEKLLPEKKELIGLYERDYNSALTDTATKLSQAEASDDDIMDALDEDWEEGNAIIAGSLRKTMSEALRTKFIILKKEPK